MKKKRKNDFDKYVEYFINSYSNIPGFNEIIQDEDQFNFMRDFSLRLADINGFRTLVIQEFIPAVNRNISESKRQINSSRFKEFLPSYEIIDETYYEVIRLAYVGLFHKFEGFFNFCMEKACRLIDNEDFKEKDFLIWVEKNLDVKLKDWKLFPVLEKINYINNCVKHYDGYPIKKPSLKGFEIHPTDKRIRIKSKEFSEDSLNLIDIYEKYFKLIIIASSIKLESEIFDLDVSSQLGISKDTFLKMKEIYIKNLISELVN